MLSLVLPLCCASTFSKQYSARERHTIREHVYLLFQAEYKFWCYHIIVHICTCVVRHLYWFTTEVFTYTVYSLRFMFTIYSYKCTLPYQGMIAVWALLQFYAFQLHLVSHSAAPQGSLDHALATWQSCDWLLIQIYYCSMLQWPPVCSLQLPATVPVGNDHVHPSAR